MCRLPAGCAWSARAPSTLLAVVIFATRGALDYKLGIPMLFAGIVGGYMGALLVKRMDAAVARRTILVYAWGLTAWFFGRMLLGH